MVSLARPKVARTKTVLSARLKKFLQRNVALDGSTSLLAVLPVLSYRSLPLNSY